MNSVDLNNVKLWIEGNFWPTFFIGILVAMLTKKIVQFGFRVSYRLVEPSSDPPADCPIRCTRPRAEWNQILGEWMVFYILHFRRHLRNPCALGHNVVLEFHLLLDSNTFAHLRCAI